MVSVTFSKAMQCLPKTTTRLSANSTSTSRTAPGRASGKR